MRLFYSGTQDSLPLLVFRNHKKLTCTMTRLCADRLRLRSVMGPISLGGISTVIVDFAF